MITRSRRQSDAFAGLGVALIAFGVWAYLYHDDMDVWVLPAMIAGSVLFIIGCCYLARAKGYHPALGLLGLLCLTGLLVLFLLPDRERVKSGHQQVKRPSSDHLGSASQA